MAFSHLINCLLLAYGPYFICYRAKNLSEYGAYKVVLFSAASYFITAAIKVILMASFLSTPSESADFDLRVELNKNIFNFIEVVGLYYAMKYKYSFLDNPALRALAISIGWGIADSITSNLFFFILNASGDEFSWKYVIRASLSNIELFEVFCLVAIILYILKNVRRTDITMSSVNIIGFIFGFVKTVIFPTVLSYLLHAGIVSEEDYRLPIAKGSLAIVFFILCKLMGAL